MRIQHNILSMNAYRNYTNNTSALGKNLEKLSSGYKINRAGDDAAGLAISEKMRAQIQGLNAAQKNVKDGISFVKTAEGAMQEIQDMMSRMKYLATQSANGTYEDKVDRNALQDEVDSLLEEINRIADSANFNDIHMLNGGAGGAGGAAGGADSAVAIEGGGKKGIADGTAQAQVSEATVVVPTTATVNAGDKLNVSFELTDGTKYDFTFTVKADKKTLVYNGEDAGAFGTASTADATGVGAAIAFALGKDSSFTDKYTIANATGKLTMTSAEEGFGDAAIKVISTSINGGTPANAAGAIKTEGKGEYSTFDVTQAQVYDAADNTQKVEDSIYTINGAKFAFAKDADSAKAFSKDVNVIIASAATPALADAKALVAAVNQKTGANIKTPTGTTVDMISKAGGSGSSSGGGFGITLQIGDTSDTFNQLKMTIGSMKTAALGVDGLKINTIDTASAAIQTIKDAINTVSTVRGNLGAYQNRLEHTQKNLSVMTENIQDAESTIRDTDVADEMMAYTKNNILIQSAQAMLAQANAVPQGVLQLLQ